MGTWTPGAGPTSGNDTFSGTSANEFASGGAGDDVINGGGGADTLEGGAGADTVDGGAGSDFIIIRGDIVEGDVVDDVGIGESISGGSGTDTLRVRGQVSFFDADTSLSSFERLTFLANDDPYNALTIRSSLLGPGLSTTLAVTGTAENFSQINVVSDGVGLNIDVSGWTFTDWTSNGTVYLYGDDGGNALTGTEYRDVFLSRAGADTMYGGRGDDDFSPSEFGLGADGAVDHMYGGLGSDHYVVFEAIDYVHEGSANGGVYDWVTSFIDYSLSANFEGLDLRGTAISATGNANDNNLAGNELNNRLYGLTGDDYLQGFAGSDLLDGGTGVDTMYGGVGNDTYIVDSTSDNVFESTDEGRDLVKVSFSYTLGDNVESLQLTGATARNGYGNALYNTIIGNAADNFLSGFAGNDTISGGGGGDNINGGMGVDTLTGGAGLDTFVFSNGLSFANIDTITDFNPVDDTIKLENSIFTGLATGALGANAFVVGTASAGAEDRLIYDPDNGRLYFDADGVGGGAQVLFAVLSSGLALTPSDFLVM